VTMWERRAEPEGFAAVMEGVRNAVPRLKGRAIAGAHDYQDPRIDRAEQAARCEFLRRFDARLAEVPFVAGDTFSAADITTLVTVDFARRAFDMPVPAERGALLRWYETVSARPSMAASRPWEDHLQEKCPAVTDCGEYSATFKTILPRINTHA
jgi:glutathione S-transferase